MAGSKLEYYLEKMPKDQLKTFRLMLSRQRSQRDQILAKLCELTLKTNLGWESIYTRLYPGEPYSEKQIRNLRSALLERLIDFVTSKSWQKSTERDLLWIQSLREWGAIKYAPGILKKVRNKIDLEPESADHHELRSRFAAEVLHQELSTLGRKTQAYLPLMERQEEAFVAQVLKTALGFREIKAVSGKDPQAPPVMLWPAIQTALEQGAWSGSRVIQLYAAAIRLSIHPSEDHLNQFVPQLIDGASRLAPSEVGNLYTIALNYCVRIWRQGSEVILHTLFQLNKTMVELGIFLGEEGIPPWHFKVIVNCAVQVRETSWARGFIDQYGHQLPAQGREPFLAFCRGLVDFYGEDYRGSESWMNQALIDNQDPFLRLDARTYLLRIFYETEDDIGMESMVHTFRVQLQRYKDLPPQRLTQYKEFVLLYRRLMGLKPNSDQHKNSLLAQVGQFPNISARKWFLDKLKEK